MLLGQAEKVRQRLPTGRHDGFAEQGAHLRPSDVEHVGPLRQVAQRHVVALRRQRVAQPCPVDVERNTRLPAEPGQLFQLPEGVERAQFGRLRDVDHARRHHVLARLVRRIGLQAMPERVGGQLAVPSGQGQHLVARGLDGPRLVYVDVARIGADGALMPAQQRVDDRRVGLRAADEEVYGRFGLAAGLADAFAGRAAVVVRAVARRLFQIGCPQAVDDFGAGALHIVAVEV